MKSRLIAFAIIILVAISLAALMDHTITTAKRVRIQERFDSMIHAVDARCDEADKTKEYGGVIKYFELIDLWHNTFSGVYTPKGYCLSYRDPTFKGHPFEPYEHKAITDAMMLSDSGQVHVMFSFEDDGVWTHRPFMVYFRRLYAGPNHIVTMIGIPFTMDNAILPTGMYALIYASYGLAAISVSILIYFLTQLLAERRKVNKALKTLGAS